MPGNLCHLLALNLSLLFSTIEFKKQYKLQCIQILQNACVCVCLIIRSGSRTEMETLFGKSFRFVFIYSRIQGKLQVANSAYARKFISCVGWLVVYW